MYKYLLNVFPLALLLSFNANAQLRTLGSDGNWSNTASWVGGLIADTPAEDVTMNNNVDVTILNTESFTIGDLSANNNNSITINAGGALTLSPGNFLTAGNNTTITVSGTFTINGDFQVNNNVNLIITGTMIVLGNVDMGNNGDLNVNGSLSVGGNFTGGNNTHVTVDGIIDVDGNLSVGNGSTLDGTGVFKVGGSCSDGTSSFCADGQLPIQLLFFKAVVNGNYVDLNWATASELNFDYFTIERSASGEVFSTIGKVSGGGNSLNRKDYFYQDFNPLMGLNYYRIKSTDFDGYTEYFNIERVEFNEIKAIQLYPNPVTSSQEITVLIGGGSSQYGMATVYDIMGRTVKQITFQGKESALDTYGMPSGVYIIKATIGIDQFSSRFVVK